MKKLITISLVSAFVACSAGDIKLPSPVKMGGKTLMQVLAERKSSRDFSSREISLQTLSSLLWAANGITRADGRRTAPTARNVQDIDVYVMTASGIYLYEAQTDMLRLVDPGDHRQYAGKQEFARHVPLTLFFVQDRSRARKTDEENMLRYAGIHTGAIMQNVYLFCAKEGLATVARAMIDYEGCAKILKLRAEQRVILAQSVGYPQNDGYIGKQAAIRKALSQLGLTPNDVRQISCELDREDGVMVYEVEFKKDGFEYDYEIDAKTGTVIKSKKERD